MVHGRKKLLSFQRKFIAGIALCSLLFFDLALALTPPRPSSIGQEQELAVPPPVIHNLGEKLKELRDQLATLFDRYRYGDHSSGYYGESISEEDLTSFEDKAKAFKVLVEGELAKELEAPFPFSARADKILKNYLDFYTTTIRNFAAMAFAKVKGLRDQLALTLPDKVQELSSYRQEVIPTSPLLFAAEKIQWMVEKDGGKITISLADSKVKRSYEEYGHYFQYLKWSRRGGESNYSFPFDLTTGPMQLVEYKEQYAMEQLLLKAIKKLLLDYLEKAMVATNIYLGEDNFSDKEKELLVRASLQEELLQNELYSQIFIGNLDEIPGRATNQNVIKKLTLYGYEILGFPQPFIGQSDEELQNTFCQILHRVKTVTDRDGDSMALLEEEEDGDEDICKDLEKIEFANAIARVVESNENLGASERANITDDLLYVKRVFADETSFLGSAVDIKALMQYTIERKTDGRFTNESLNLYLDSLPEALASVRSLFELNEEATSVGYLSVKESAEKRVEECFAIWKEAISQDYILCISETIRWAFFDVEGQRALVEVLEEKKEDRQYLAVTSDLKMGLINRAIVQRNTLEDTPENVASRGNYLNSHIYFDSKDELDIFQKFSLYQKIQLYPLLGMSISIYRDAMEDEYVNFHAPIGETKKEVTLFEALDPEERDRSEKYVRMALENNKESIKAMVATIKGWSELAQAEDVAKYELFATELSNHFFVGSTYLAWVKEIREKYPHQFSHLGDMGHLKDMTRVEIAATAMSNTVVGLGFAGLMLAQFGGPIFNKLRMPRVGSIFQWISGGLSSRGVRNFSNFAMVLIATEVGLNANYIFHRRPKTIRFLKSLSYADPFPNFDEDSIKLMETRELALIEDALRSNRKNFFLFAPLEALYFSQFAMRSPRFRVWLYGKYNATMERYRYNVTRDRIDRAFERLGRSGDSEGVAWTWDKDLLDRRLMERLVEIGQSSMNAMEQIRAAKVATKAHRAILRRIDQMEVWLANQAKLNQYHFRVLGLDPYSKGVWREFAGMRKTPEMSPVARESMDVLDRFLMRKIYYNDLISSEEYSLIYHTIFAPRFPSNGTVSYSVATVQKIRIEAKEIPSRVINLEVRVASKGDSAPIDEFYERYFGQRRSYREYYADDTHGDEESFRGTGAGQREYAGGESSGPMTLERAYRVLGLNQGVTDQNVIRRAYRKIALETHPDRVSSREDLTPQEMEALIEKFKEANEANELIMNYLSRSWRQ